ncbi:hypothetical protein IK110_03875 [Candidatus Saccharibacteria bacterium]|nr:hypothetical protein [Candidatus Saccharibacteria bacterium]
MKLIIGDKVYLQKYEIAHITHSLNGIPGSMLDELFGDDPDGIFYMNSPEDGYRFECVFKDPKNVEWLTEQDWIVDFDRFFKMELDELEDLQERLRVAYSTCVEEFNAKDDAYRKAHFQEKRDFFNKLWHKVNSLDALIGFRKGKIKFVFPDEYQNADVTTTKKKPSFFARLFSRSAQ